MPKNFKNDPYEQEARERWGDEAVDQSKAKLENMSEDEQVGVANMWDAIFTKLALLREQSPEAAEVQTAMKELYTFLNDNFGSYTLDAFEGLGQMYITDERFTRNINEYGEGLAQFMSEAMAIYSRSQK